MRRVNPESGFRGAALVRRAVRSARIRLRDLIAAERQRARLHISLIRRDEPQASPDRLANVIVARWVRAATLEGGVTGAAGFLGVPVNALLLTYMQIALIVSIAEVYDTPLEDATGEDVVLGVLWRAHGLDDLSRAAPRVLGALARSLTLRHGLVGLGRWIPLIAAPVAAKLNERDMQRLGVEAQRRFGGVVRIS